MDVALVYIVRVAVSSFILKHGSISKLRNIDEL